VLNVSLANHEQKESSIKRNFNKLFFVSLIIERN